MWLPLTTKCVAYVAPLDDHVARPLLFIAGGRIEVDMADRLVSGLRSLLSQSFANRAFWKQKVGKRWKSINSVRWGASHESNQDIMENFADMRLFLAELVTAEGKDNKTARRLLVRFCALLLRVLMCMMLCIGCRVVHTTGVVSLYLRRQWYAQIGVSAPESQ